MFGNPVLEWGLLSENIESLVTLNTTKSFLTHFLYNYAKTVSNNPIEVLGKIQLLKIIFPLLSEVIKTQPW